MFTAIPLRLLRHPHRLGTGILSVIRILADQLPATHSLADPKALLHRFDDLTTQLEQKSPTLLYNENQVQSFSTLAKELGISVPDSVSEPLGNAPGTWTPFPDTIEGLQKLKKRYKLIILSNIDNRNIQGTVEKGLKGAEFDAVYTAQDVGSYKPSHRNFEYLFGHARKELDVEWERGDLLHVARSLKMDHVPAKELGLRSVWISRGAEKTGEVDTYEGKLGFEWRFDTIGDFANEVEKQFAAKGL
ncbi:HAD-like domain-containing protein [Pseudomassariella vexata]|uniref:HAD-like domain-containing protein n=1 Tax=Pseudomassariella vexata TaxID=1141098 RepID=A0A1Y2D8D2_9PEZI|nr:HAD-like domain-containing protein [Pseudomassariella vexata]ORY55522.1 HAD-like domain-containing protein [Pseudomassariella vexata]